MARDDSNSAQRETAKSYYPHILVTGEDGRLKNTESDHVQVPKKPERVLPWRENEDLSSAISKREHYSDTPSEGQTVTTVPDHGDTAQLQQNGKERSSGANTYQSAKNDLVGVGEGLPLSNGINTDSEDDEDLWSLIEDKLIAPPPDNGKEFLPLDELRILMAKPRVRRALEKPPCAFDHERACFYANKVCNTTDYGSIQKTTRQKIFTILVYIAHIQALPGIIDEDICDAQLPFTLEKSPKSRWHLTYRRTDGTTSDFHGSYQWERQKLRAFEEKQWLVLSPFFNMQSSKPLFHPLEPRIVLPFIEGGDGQHASYGGFSTVWKVKIHHAHHNCTQHTQPYFAVKQLYSHDKTAFEQEVQALKRFNRHGHQHLMKLLATYQHQDNWYFIFPWANGNLRDFWKRYERPSPDHQLVVWLAEQSAGIASGLRLVQHPPNDGSLTVPSDRNFGRHGDLKPENVLWFRDNSKDESHPGSGILKIADFGLTRFHREVSKSDVDVSGLGVSLTYKAPEVDVTKRVAPAYDIWTLGCLFLEFITWYLMGWEGVDQFSLNRVDDDRGKEIEIPLDTFFNIESIRGAQMAILKPSVRKWIDDLHEHPNCSLFFHHLLTYISHHLLRVRATDRHRCEEVVVKLYMMARRSKEDPVYAFLGCPKPLNKTDTNETNKTVSDDGYTGVESGLDLHSTENGARNRDEIGPETFTNANCVRIDEIVDQESSAASAYPTTPPSTQEEFGRNGSWGSEDTRERRSERNEDAENGQDSEYSNHTSKRTRFSNENEVIWRF